LLWSLAGRLAAAGAPQLLVTGSFGTYRMDDIAS
jgi:hypothetical protein